MWNEFNIKTFPSETIVFRDGTFCPELSTIPVPRINHKYDLPIHIIYVGEITDKNTLDIDLNISNQDIFISVDIKNKTPAFLDIFIKNTGKDSEIRGHILMENFDNLTCNITAHHQSPDTTILIQSKVLAQQDSISKLSGTAIIAPNCPECKSDIGFTVLPAPGAKIDFTPSQRISSEPARADHSASLFHPNPVHVEYLRTLGLSGAEANIALVQAFKNNFSLF